jgi:AAA family ATP:ADP antiporter
VRDGKTTRPRRLASGVYLCLLACVVLMAYALVRPASESLFLEVHGAEALPFAWLAVALTALPVVAAFNAAAARAPLGRVMLGVLAASAASLLLLHLVLWRGAAPWASFALYVWKDVHIVVLLEVLWSFANLVFETGSAKWVYGLFCASGSLGGLSGNLLVGALAQRWGTTHVPAAALPLFAIAALLVVGLAAAAGHPAPSARAGAGIGWRDAVDIVRKSPYVGWLVLLIAAVQLVVTLVDYIYSGALALAYPDTHERTAVIGRIYAAIDAASLALQLSSGIIIRSTGVAATLTAVPALLGAAIAAFVAAPRFALVAAAKVASKAFDYSLFRAAKEMLYIPLDYADKTRGKALVDMLAYRVAKGGASLVLLALPGAVVTAAAVAGIGGWLAITLVVVKRYRRLLRR